MEGHIMQRSCCRCEWRILRPRPAPASSPRRPPPHIAAPVRPAATRGSRSRRGCKPTPL